MLAHEVLELLGKENHQLERILSDLVRDDPNFYISILEKMNCSKKRLKIIKAILDNSIKVCVETKNSILKASVKSYLGERYSELDLNQSGVYGSNPDLEYNIAKNGQNIIKHGVDFSHYYAWVGKCILISSSNRPGQEGRTVAFYVMTIDENTSRYLDEAFKEKKMLFWLLFPLNPLRDIFL